MALTPFRYLTTYFAGKVDEDTKIYEAKFLIWLKAGGTIEGISNKPNGERVAPSLHRKAEQSMKAARLAELNQKNAQENMKQGMAKVGVVLADDGHVTTPQLLAKEKENKATAAAADDAAIIKIKKEKKATKHRRARTTADRESDDEVSDDDNDDGKKHISSNDNDSDDDNVVAAAVPSPHEEKQSLRIDINNVDVEDHGSSSTPIATSTPMSNDDDNTAKAANNGNDDDSKRSSSGSKRTSQLRRGDSLMRDGVSDMPEAMHAMPALQRTDSTQALMESPEYAHFASLRHCTLLPVVEFGQDLLKLVFYRQLFINVTEIRTFILFQAINFARDVLRYPFRMHRRFYNIVILVPIKVCYLPIVQHTQTRLR
jgi:hypothetical protein